MRHLITFLFFTSLSFGQGVINAYVTHPIIVNPELYTVNNALATGANEANATTGLTNQGLSTLSSISSSPSPQDGSYLIKAIGPSTPDRFEEGLSLDSGETYDIEYWAWSDTTSGGRSQIWVGFTSSPSNYYTTTPTLYSHTLTTNSSSQTLRFYAMVDNAEVYVDGLSIKVSP